MFVKINYYNYRLLSKISFFQQVLILLDRFDLATLLILSYVEEFRAIVNEAIRISRIINKSELTAIIKLYDSDRDRLFRCLHHLLKGYSYHFDEAKMEAAIVCLGIIDRFVPNIPNLPYHEETIVLNDVLAALESSEEAKLALETLELTEVVTRMKAKNIEFSEAYADRQIESSEKTPVTLVGLLEQAEAKFQNVQDMIFAYSKTKGEEAYLPMIKVLNNVIEEFNQREQTRPSKTAEN